MKIKRLNLGAITKIGWIWIGINAIFIPASNILIKYGNQQTTLVNSVQIAFNHPFMTTALMFVGELLCGFVALFELLKSKPACSSQSKNKFRVVHVLLFFVPAFCDFVNFLFQVMALFQCAASVFDMMRNGQILFIAVGSMLFRQFRTKFDLPQMIGLIVLFLGLSITGIISVIKPQTSAVNPVLGIVFLLIAMIFVAAYCISQEAFVKNINIPASLCVCFEGFWGIVIMCIIIPIANVVKNPFSGEFFEDTRLWVAELKQNSGLVIIQVVYVIVSTILNLSGLEVTKNSSSSVRVTFMATFSVITWIFSFCVGWDTFDEIESPIKLVGFAITILGVMIYNNILLVIPFLKKANKEQFFAKQEQTETLVVSITE